MSDIAHNDACKAATDAAAAFRLRWPNYCRGCGGAGMVHDPGGRDEPPSTDSCGCIEAGKCPLCAGPVELIETPHADYCKCAACGWDESKDDQPVCPDAECYCWEAADET